MMRLFREEDPVLFYRQILRQGYVHAQIHTHNSIERQNARIRLSANPEPQAEPELTKQPRFGVVQGGRVDPPAPIAEAS